MSNPKKIYYRITNEEGAWCITDDVMANVDDLSPGQGLHIEAVAMTEEEFNALPEFVGW